MFTSIKDKLEKYSIILTKVHKRSRFTRYAVPVVLVCFVVAAKIFLRTFVSDQTSYNILTLIIILSAFYGGLGPGLLATISVTVLDAVFFLPPGESFFGVYNILSTIILFIGGMFISIISFMKHQADLQKDGFIGFASHELKNPLTTIQGYAQMLQKSNGKVSQKQAFEIGETITRQTRQATNIINELLDLTKIEAGKLSLQFKNFSIYDCVREIVSMQRIVFQDRKIEFVGKTDKKVYADRFRIEQVIINLISNAVRYSKNSDPVIVTIRQQADEIVVSVEDFGRGIAKKNLGKIFLPYYREEKSSHTAIQGLGLGLYLSQEIVNRHNGRLWVKSAVDKGSTFFLALPTK